MNPESKQNQYDNFPEDNEVIEHYKPKFLARGGDHLVYEVADHPNVVIKASTFKIKDILIYNTDHGHTLDELPESFKEETESKNKQIRVLREYFGTEHALKERRYMMKVPVTPELLEAVFKDDAFNRALPEAAKNLKEVWTSVVVQEQSKEITDKNIEHQSLHFGNFVETRKGDLKLDSEELKELNDALIKGIPWSAEDAELFFVVQDNPKTGGLRNIVEKAGTDPHLKEVLQDFIKKAITFAEDTGNILAMAGQDNVIFFQKEDGWDYLLVDAIPVHNEAMFSFAQDALHQITNGKNFWEGKSEEKITYEKEVIMKVYNFVRTINGLAVALDMQERVELILDEDKDKNIDLEKIIE